MFEDEVWKPIRDFPNYMVSSYGRVKHINHVNPRLIQTNDRGFPVILLSSPSAPIRYLRQINKLVAKAFLPPPLYDDETAVWHKDGNLQNCHVSNLMWERRDRVLEWNDMHRRGRPKYRTPMVKNTRTGDIYRDAYDCAMQEGILESTVVWKIEKGPGGMYDDENRYRYVSDKEVERHLR